MSQTSYSVIESAFPEDIIPSGDYESAENLLTKESIPSEILSEIFYRLGNRFYSSGQKQAAELAWQKSRELTDITEEFSSITVPDSRNQEKYYLQTIGSVIFLIVCLYVFVFTLFPREPEPFQFTTIRSTSGELSFWDEWWNTGRPVTRSMRQRFGPEQLWPMLKRTFENLFGTQNDELSEDIREKLKRWLELSRKPQLSKGPNDHYDLTGRGLFEEREFEDALATWKDGLHDA